MDFLDTPEKKERRLVHVPMGRFGEAIEIAKAALFCASTLYCLMAPGRRFNSFVLNLNFHSQWPATIVAMSR